MTLNPITALSEQLQKLINEHGSSTILRDHLALFKDQVVSLEKKNLSLRPNVLDLKSEKGVLQAEIEKLKAIIKNHEKQASIRKIAEQQTLHDNLLSEVEINILLYVATNASKNSTQIAEAMGIAETIIDFHLLGMKEKAW